jgi:Zn-dependent protease with chaperone function
VDFFSEQQDARRRSKFLMAACLAAALTTVISTALFIRYCMQHFMKLEIGEAGAYRIFSSHQGLFWIAAGVSVFMLVAMLLKHASLRPGGRAVAELMGGRLVTSGSADFKEKQLLNVVEEMAIASGLSVPPVYILPEEGLNAFTAGRSGYDRPDVVIAVSKGALDLFDRDELQAVLAHEFSHILFNDVSLNMRFITLVFGVSALAETGSFILRSMRINRVGIGARPAGRLLFVVAVLAFGCMVIGYVGSFFGNILRAMICRQREFLADAAAVQFTRNPQGLSTALQKIGGWSRHSRLINPRSAEIAHMFFADYRPDRFPAALFATHPSLEKRIERIDPGWSGEYPLIRSGARQKAGLQLRQVEAFHTMEGADLEKVLAPLVEASRLGVLGRKQSIPVQRAQEALGQAGSPKREHLEYARAVLDHMPEPLLKAAREPFGAGAVVYCLLISPARDEVRRLMLKELEVNPSPGILQLTVKLLPLFEAVPVQSRLPLLEVCTPALKMMVSEQRRSFYAKVQALIGADSEVDLFEWVLHAYIRHHIIGASFKAAKPNWSVRPGREELAEVLGALATLGHRSDEERHDAVRAYQAGVAQLGVALPHMGAEKDYSGKALSQALVTLATLPMLEKKKLLRACLACIEYDGKITIGEAELLRAVSNILGCPMPPIASARTDRSP